MLLIIFMNTAVAIGQSDLAIIQDWSFLLLFSGFEGRKARFSEPNAIVFREVGVSIFDMFLIEAYC